MMSVQNTWGYDTKINNNIWALTHNRSGTVPSYQQPIIDNSTQLYDDRFVQYVFVKLPILLIFDFIKLYYYNLLVSAKSINP